MPFSIKNAHLGISAFVVFTVSFVYGLFPNSAMSYLFDFEVKTIDLHQVFRAIMGLYIGVALFWMYGIFQPSFWRAATLSNVLFMFGLVFGRTISILADGIPSLLFCVGLLLELIVGLWGVYNLKRWGE